MKKIRFLYYIFYTAMIVFSANSFYFVKAMPSLWWCPVLAFIIPNLFIGFFDMKVKNTRLAICNHGRVALSVFLISAVISVIYHVILMILHFSWGWSMLISYIAHLLLFWNGIISVYCTSVQLGIKQRVLGALCGPIPIVNLWALKRIIKITGKEIIFESEKLVLNEKRKHLQICKTKYPVLLVHGVFFRDSKYFNYWGRVSSELIKNGAVVYYGEHQSALSTVDSALELGERIKNIVDESGCGKLNIIAHSKGGLDCREAIANGGISDYVASVTTINTPHRGCYFADHLLEKIPNRIKNKAAVMYNSAARAAGDKNPDFLSAVNDLRHSVCEQRDKELGVPSGIYCQSFGSIQKNSRSGKFPLNLSHGYVKHFDGANDGLVSEGSFSWGHRYVLVTTEGKRGISHGDMIDLNRENIEGFDVREFYVDIVNDLKNKGF